MAESEKKTEASGGKKIKKTAEFLQYTCEKAGKFVLKLKEKCQNLSALKLNKNYISACGEKIKKFPYHEKYGQLCAWCRQRKFTPNLHLSSIKSVIKSVSDSWKFAVLAIGSFLFFYYTLGGLLVEKIDLQTECKINSEKNFRFQTADCMAFLIRRETDDKMWTPNLPVFFPAYVLDNMPNFQEGMISAIKDMSGALKKMQNHTQDQRADLKEIYKLLSYSPKIWVLSRQGTFGIAPSANSQYRKAAKKLKQYNERAIFISDKEDLLKLMGKINENLHKISHQTEEYVREYSSDWTDLKADDYFYQNKGYAFALWQIVHALGTDYKQVLLDYNLYAEWTYLVSSLKKAAEFKPLVVRNGEITALMTPNHLMIQNYFLSRAEGYGEDIRYRLTTDKNAD